METLSEVITERTDLIGIGKNLIEQAFYVKYWKYGQSERKDTTKDKRRKKIQRLI